MSLKKTVNGQVIDQSTKKGPPILRENFNYK
jgi:hypothetical protein